MEAGFGEALGAMGVGSGAVFAPAEFFGDVEGAVEFEAAVGGEAEGVFGGRDGDESGFVEAAGVFGAAALIESGELTRGFKETVAETDAAFVDDELAAAVP